MSQWRRPVQSPPSADTGVPSDAGAHHSSRLVARQMVLVSVTLAAGSPDKGDGQIDAAPSVIDDAWGASRLPGDASGMGGSPGDDWVESRVTDISRDGCGLVTTLALVPGMAVRIMFPGFEARPARIVWVNGDAAGCCFTTPLPAAILDYILRMSDPDARG